MNKFIRNNKKKLENREKSRELINKALDKAIELDDNLSEAYITKGNILAKFDWDWEGMKNMAEKGLKINPNNAKGHILLAKYYLINSMFDKAIEEAAYAAKLDPLNPNICSQYANVLVLSKNYNLAENVYLDVLELFPNFGFAWDGIGRCYYLMDRKEDAIISWSKLHDIMGNYDMAEYFRNENPQKSLDHWLSEATVTNKLYCSNPSIISMAHLFANDKSGSIEYLKYSYEVKNEDLPLIMMNPIFASISETDTYKEIGLKVGLQNN